jgi:hypothetical protein
MVAARREIRETDVMRFPSNQFSKRQHGVPCHRMNGQESREN